MTKKELEKIEKALTEASLRYTAEVKPDITPPSIYLDSNEIRNGYAFNEPSLRVTEACTSSIYHNDFGWDKTTTHGSRSLYSSRLLALKAMRNECEKQCAFKLRQIDRMIEKEIDDQEKLEAEKK